MPFSLNLTETVIFMVIVFIVGNLIGIAFGGTTATNYFQRKAVASGVATYKFDELGRSQFKFIEPKEKE